MMICFPLLFCTVLAARCDPIRVVLAFFAGKARCLLAGFAGRCTKEFMLALEVVIACMKLRKRVPGTLVYVLVLVRVLVVALVLG